jgi:hypothetical protein
MTILVCDVTFDVCDMQIAVKSLKIKIPAKNGQNSRNPKNVSPANGHAHRTSPVRTTPATHQRVGHKFFERGTRHQQ